MDKDLDYYKARCSQLESLLRRINKAIDTAIGPAAQAEEKADDTPYKMILSMYRDLCVKQGWPDVRALSVKRKSLIKTLWRSHLPELEDWRNYFIDARDKPFLLGQNDRGWKGDLDFLIREQSVLNMQEGKYDRQ